MTRKYNTKSRQILTSYLEGLDGKAFCVKDFCTFLETRNLNMDTATIYRNLDKLTGEGKLIKTRQSGDDNCYYQYVAQNSSCHSHLHIRCIKCGAVIHLEGKEMDRFYSFVRDELGFRLNTEASVLSGICKSCQNKQEGILV